MLCNIQFYNTQNSISVIQGYFRVICHSLPLYILSRFRSINWWLDLLTTYTHHLELHIIMAAPLICTIYKSPQHQLSLFQPAVPAPAVTWQRLLSVEILQLPVLHSFLCRLLFRNACQLLPQLNWITTFSQPSLQSSTALSTAKTSTLSFIIPSAQRQSYVTTNGQSASLSWCQAPTWGLRPDFYYCQRVEGLLMWGALSDKRTGLPFTNAAGPRQHSQSWVQVPQDSWLYITVSYSWLPQPGGPGPRIYIPKEQGGPVS
jgi:hypothetical protein